MKFIFDATFGAPWVANLRSFFYNHGVPRPEIYHLYDLFGEEDKDDVDWIPKLARLTCVVITGDQGRHSRIEHRLPAICKEYKVTHILMSPGMHEKAGKFERARSVIVLWHEIVAASVGVPGARYQIRAANSSYTRFALIQKPYTMGRKQGKR